MTASPPVIIVAPTQRCGSTLLQRLLNSTREMIVYGENFYMLQKLPDTLSGLHNNIPQRQDAIRRTTKLFMETDFDFEASSLFPDYEQYLGAARAGFYALIKFYGDYSKSLNFNHWGIKHQVRGPQGYLFLRRLLPQARYLCIYRDIRDVAKSAKARWPEQYTQLGAYQQLGMLWQENLKAILSQRDQDNVLLFKYEDFIADPQPHLDRLEDFVGLTSIDRGVMERRVNNYPVMDPNDPRNAKNVYQKPVDLSAAEMEALLRACGEIHQSLGYGDRVADTGKPATLGPGATT